MFKFVEHPTFAAEVKVRWPDREAPGGFRECSFGATFRAIGHQRACDLADEIRAAPAPEQERRRHDILLEALIGWGDDLVDETDTPIPFSPEMARRLFNYGWIADGIYEAYGRGLAGLPSGN